MFILPEIPSTSQKLARGLGEGIGIGASSLAQRLLGNRQESRENESLKRLTGQDFGGLTPDIKKLLLEKTSQPSQESYTLPSRALDEMEALIGTKGVGMSGLINLSNEARYNRGRFQSLQAAILPIFKSMFPRGMTEKEFKFIQDHYIPQPSDTEEKMRGKISGLRSLVSEGPKSEIITQKEIPLKNKTSFKDRVFRSKHVKMIPPDGGEPIWIPKNEVKAAQAAGGKVIK